MAAQRPRHNNPSFWCFPLGIGRGPASSKKDSCCSTMTTSCQCPCFLEWIELRSTLAEAGSCSGKRSGFCVEVSVHSRTLSCRFFACFDMFVFWRWVWVEGRRNVFPLAIHQTDTFLLAQSRCFCQRLGSLEAVQGKLDVQLRARAPREMTLEAHWRGPSSRSCGC